ncbi:MAG: glutamate--tRNA ligase, partial [Candidatus Binatia bacterium]
YRQSERRDLYEEAMDRLLESGRAYYAFDTREELDALRRAAAAEGRAFKYQRPDPLPTTADAARAQLQDLPVVLRFRTPDEPITIHDEILGDVCFPAGEIDDFVLVKSNGWPTYHFAVVVDDFHMRVTHVLRAQEHLMNTPKHVFLQQALGYLTPRYAHLPLVFNIDGSKMSKRDKHKVVRQAVRERIKAGKWTEDRAAESAGCAGGALRTWLAKKADTELTTAEVERLAGAAGVTIPEIDVHDFRVAGYLPEALLNFIALIGWSPGEDREKLTVDEMIAAFSLDRVNKTAGRFDRDKLVAMNTDWAAASSPERLLAAFKDWASLSGSDMAELDDETLAAVLDACRGFRTFRDVELKAGILFAPDERVEYDPKALRKVLEKKDGRGYQMLERLLPELESLDPWTAESIEAFIRGFCETHETRLGDLAQPLRVAVAGRAVSPAIGLTLTFLGKNKTLARIRTCLQGRG